MQPHTAVQQPNYGGTDAGGNRGNRIGNLFPVLSFLVSQCVGITELYKPQNDAAQHPQDSKSMDWVIISVI